MPHIPERGDRPPWRAKVVTLFPEAFPGILGLSLSGAALAAGLWSLDTIDIRGFGHGRHRTVDDHPAGGGAGMVLRCDVVAAAIDAAREQAEALPLLYASPRGRPLAQGFVRDLAAGPGLMMLAGRFEGVDQRVLDARGNFVKSVVAPADASVSFTPGRYGRGAPGAGSSCDNRFVWDGTGADGRVVAPGVYLVRFRVGNEPPIFRKALFRPR